MNEKQGITINEAIKELEEFRDCDYAQRAERLKKALGLSVEGLKRIKEFRRDFILLAEELLSGEKEE